MAEAAQCVPGRIEVVALVRIPKEEILRAGTIESQSTTTIFFRWQLSGHEIESQLAAAATGDFQKELCISRIRPGVCGTQQLLSRGIGNQSVYESLLDPGLQVHAVVEILSLTTHDDGRDLDGFGAILCARHVLHGLPNFAHELG